MSTRIVRSCIIAIAAASAGCASTSPEPAFKDAAALVDARIARHITWDQGGSDDKAAAARVRELLSRELTVDAAVAIALVDNRGLQATYEDLSIAQADLVQAGLLSNPALSGTLAIPVAGQASTGYTVSLAQDFLSVFTIAARKRIAESELEAAKRRVADAVLRVAFDVTSAFYALESAEQIAAMRRTILEAGDAAVDLARRQRTAGNISELDLANQEALYEQVRTDLVRSEAEVTAAHEHLARLMGVWGPEAAFRVANKLPELPAHEAEVGHLESLAISRRLDLAAAHEEAQAISHALAMAQNYRFLGSTSAGATFERSPEGYSVITPGASIEAPIFDQKQAVIARLEAQTRAALARESSLAISIRSEVRESRARVLANRAVVDRYAKVVVPLRRRVVTLTEQQYEAMLVGAHQLLLAKQNEVNAYRELIEALRDYWVARADLDRATGGALEGSTEKTNAERP
jgi:cobalt-zinc-cadmium efflux system outer membrane protein